jgi:multidrug efflux pump subunit AcrA (membrane-fusion protein)
MSPSRNRSAARLVLACAIAVVGLMLVPLPYKIRCNAVLEPSQRRFAVAPYEGLLERSLVETGDVVAQDQTLAVMDGKELRWELAGLAADRDRAAKQRDVSLAAHEIPDAQLAEMEVQRLDYRIRLLKYREDHLEIKSPIAGVVLVSKSENAERLPVQVGDALFEVAPLSPLKLLIDVPAEDVAFVKLGQEVQLRLDAYPEQAVVGTITKIRPRSEIRDEQNVFVAEILLNNPQRSFRPGMDGKAKVIAAQRPLGWILFHKAYDKALGWLGF